MTHTGCTGPPPAVAQFPLTSKGFPPAESQIRAGEFEFHSEPRTEDEASPRVVLHSMGRVSAQLRWQLSGMALSLPVKPFADNDASLFNQTNFQVSLVAMFCFWFGCLGRSDRQFNCSIQIWHVTMDTSIITRHVYTSTELLIFCVLNAKVDGLVSKCRRIYCSRFRCVY